MKISIDVWVEAVNRVVCSKCNKNAKVEVDQVARLNTEDGPGWVATQLRNRTEGWSQLTVGAGARKYDFCPTCTERLVSDILIPQPKKVED